MRRPLGILLVAFAALTAAMALHGCTTKVKAPTAPGPNATPFTPDSVQTIFTNNCAFSGCHAPPSPHAGMDLSASTSYAAIVDVDGAAGGACAGTKRVKPFDSASSCLYERVTGAVTPQMPLGGPPLAAAEIATIQHWIDAGAPAHYVLP